MKYAVVTDTHAGVRSESAFFLDQSRNFFLKQFFPFLKKHQISRIIHLGDLVDRRKYISFSTTKNLRESFVDPIIQGGFELDILPGNHDLPLKNVASINAEREILPRDPGIRIHDRPSYLLLDQTPSVVLPWICEENQKETVQLLNSKRGQVCLSHLELVGFDQYRGKVAQEGMDPAPFAHFKSVLSGHYHHKSSRGNIHYLGSPFEMTWNDYDDPKGFHVFDSNTFELQFIENPNRVHSKIFYDDTQKKPTEIDSENVAGKIVKVIVSGKANPAAYDQFVDNLMKANPVSTTVVDDHLKMDAAPELETMESTNDLLTMMLAWIEENGSSLDKASLGEFLTTLYRQASMIEV